MQYSTGINQQAGPIEPSRGALACVSSCDLPHEIVRKIVFESLQVALDCGAHLHIVLQSYRPVCRKWNAATESAAILYANSLGIDGLKRMCKNARMDSLQVGSLVMRRGSEIARWHTETEMQVLSSSINFEAAIFVRPALKLLNLGDVKSLFPEDYLAITMHLPKLEHLVVDQSFGDKALQIVAYGLQNLRTLDLGAAVALTAKGIGCMAQSSMSLSALTMPTSRRSCFPLNFFSCFRPQSEIEQLIGSFSQLHYLCIANYALTDISGLCQNFPKITALRLANCGLNERDLLIIHRYYPHLDALDVSHNPAAQHGIITLVCWRSKETDIAAKATVTDKNLVRLCHQLKREFPKFKF